MVLPAAESLIVLTVAPQSFIIGTRPDRDFLARARPAEKERALVDAEQEAQREATLLDPPAIEVQAVARWGNPIEETLRAARAFGSDLIILGAKGHSDLGLMLLGSVSQGIVQHSTIPILVARPHAAAFDNILVGFDGSRPAQKGLSFLDRLALPHDTTVHITYAFEPYPVPAGLSAAQKRAATADAQRLDDHRLSLAERTLHAARDLAARPGRRVESEIVAGPIAPGLQEAAKRHGAGLIVVGSRKPSAARDYLVGSTAERLVRHANASVLVVR
jgi:nucleotide-binding universal stress UspA family protein